MISDKEKYDMRMFNKKPVDKESVDKESVDKEPIDKDTFNKVRDINSEKFPHRRAELYVDGGNDGHGTVKCFDGLPGDLVFTADFEVKGKLDYDSREFLDSELYKVVSFILETDYKCGVEKLVPWLKFMLGRDSKLDKIKMSFIFSDSLSYEVKAGYSNEKVKKADSLGYKEGNIHSYVYKDKANGRKYTIYVDLPDGKSEIPIEELFKLRTAGVNDMDIIGDFKVKTIPCKTEIRETFSVDSSNLYNIKVFRLCNFKRLYMGMDADEYEKGELLKLKYWGEDNKLEKINNYTAKLKLVVGDAITLLESGEKGLQMKKCAQYSREPSDYEYNTNSIVMTK